MQCGLKNILKSDKTMTKTVYNRNITPELIPYIRRVDLSCSTSSGPHWDQNSEKQQRHHESYKTANSSKTFCGFA